MRAVVVTRPGELRVMDLPVPVPGPYQALVRTEVAVLCNSTDRKLVEGHFPGVEHYPLVLGHEGAGIVEAVGERVRAFRPGDRAVGGLLFDFQDPSLASGWGGFSEYTIVNDHDAMVEDGVADAAHGWRECYEIQRPVDPALGPEDAALLCTWREVHGSFGDFRLEAGNAALVFGGGPVGQSFVKLCKLFGLGWVGLVDRHPSKRARAISLGADAAMAPEGEEVEEAVRLLGRPLDAVIDAVGSPRIVNRALPMLRMGGSVCVYGVLSDPELRLAKATAPYNFNLLVHQWPTRRREREAQGPLTTLIREGRLSAREFVTHDLPVERIAEGLKAVSAGQAMKCLLRF